MDLRIYFMRVFGFARENYACTSQQSFNGLLREACPSYVGNASTLSKLKSGDGVSDRTQHQLKEAIDAFCSNRNISVGELPKLEGEESSLKKHKLRLQSVPLEFEISASDLPSL